ncbi:MAG TPA: alpha-(1-_3)-arabinofuranosyltransferase family protein [Kineosporiaceae bacterium]
MSHPVDAGAAAVPTTGPWRPGDADRRQDVPAAGSPGSVPGRPGGSAERRLLVALAVAALAVVLSPAPGVLLFDTKPEVFLAPWRTLAHSFSAWQDSPYLGGPNFNVGLAPVTLVTGLLDVVGIRPWLIARLWRAGLVVLAGAGARRLYADLTAGTPADTPTGRVVTAVAYAANPYLLLGGATTPTMLPYALLPWFLASLRRGFAEPRGWVHPARAALWMAAMTGMNAGVVPLLQLVALPALLLDARIRERRRWPHLLRVTARALALAGLLSLYWLVPAITALGLGSAIAGTTESLSAINAGNSAAEVLRGLGFWPLYGADPGGPFLPDLVAFVTSPPIIVASFAGPVAAAAGAAVSRSRVRLLGVLLLAFAVPIMVGMHPPDAPTPFGRLLGLAFERVPGAVAFRTTNKAGAVLELGLGLLVGLGAAAFATRLPGRRARVSAGSAAALVAALGVAPAFGGGLFSLRAPVPGYWREAAGDLDDAGSATRVLFVPGDVQAQYRWGYRVPDDLGNALFSRPTVVRTTVPNGTAGSADLLAGVDLRLQDGDLPRGALSALARYVGAGDVLVRNDVRWEPAGGARPATVAAAAAVDPGLRLVRTYGGPGMYTAESTATAADRADAALPPLQRYAVAGARPPAGQASASGAVILDGDGAALPDLAAAGLLGGDPALLEAGALTPAALRQALADGARIVLTDTNGRREWATGRLANGTGALAPAGTDVTPSRVLYGPDRQTVAVQDGNASVTTTGRGMIFGPWSTGDPLLAFDGDVTTAWEVGNLGTGAGNALVVHTRGVLDVPQVTLRLPAGPGPRVSRVRITVSGGGPRFTREADLPASPAEPLTVHLGTGQAPARGDTVTIEILATAGIGYGPVGFAEVGIPGVRVAKVARLPVALAAELAGLDAVGRATLAATPVDVLLHRSLGAPGDPTDDEEPRLARDLTLPDRRGFTISGSVRLAASVPDDQLDELAASAPGETVPPPAVVATSSSRLLGNPDLRASRAVDAVRPGVPNLATGWRPAEPVVGEWLQVRFPRRQIDHFTVTQTGTGGAESALATRARVTIDGGAPVDVTLAAGTTRVVLHPTIASVIRLTLLDRVGSGTVQITDLGIPGVTPVVVPSGSPARTGSGSAGPAGVPGCRTIASIDGRPLAAAVQGTVADLLTGRAVPFTGCRGASAVLEAGSHAVRPVADWVVDDLDLAGAGSAAAPRAVRVGVQLLSRDDTAVTLRTAATGTPYYVVAGTGYDPSWRASADGVDLGAPVLVDGYSAGWRVADGGGHVVRITYRPQRAFVAAAWAGGAALLVCLLTAAGLRSRPRLARRARAPDGRWLTRLRAIVRNRGEDGS